MSTVSFSYRGSPITLEVHEGEFIGESIRTTNAFYESNILEFVESHFPSQKTVIDVGANIGNHSKFFSEVLNADRVVAFEPESSNFRLLSANLGQRAELHQTALGDHAGCVECITAPENRGVVFLREAQTGVELRTLDSFEITEVSLLKVDVVEGYLEVLRGAIETIRRNRPTLLVHGRFNEIFPLIASLNYVGLYYWQEHHTVCFVPVEQIPRTL